MADVADYADGRDSAPTMCLTKPVYLVGFMGAGKSSVSRALAAKCGIPAVDADVYLERRARRTVAEIFAESGEEAFRDLESACLEELSRRAELVGCGGGVVIRDRNIQVMHDTGFTILLDATVENVAARIRFTESRPLLKDMDTARAIWQERRPQYIKAADAIVDTNGRSTPRIARDVERILRDHRILVDCAQQ